MILGWCKSNLALHYCTFPLDITVHSQINIVMLYIILMHISCFLALFFSFIANDLLPVLYFMFIVDYRNDVSQKANSRFFFFFF